MSDQPTLYRPSTDEDCADEYGSHIFDYGAHHASADNPFACIVAGCSTVLMPVVPVDTQAIRDELDSIVGSDLYGEEDENAISNVWYLLTGIDDRKVRPHGGHTSQDKE